MKKVQKQIQPGLEWKSILIGLPIALALWVAIIYTLTQLAGS